ncbi:hypothetical protein F0A16_01130 [Salinicola corii]|uniref:Uncharacterized protein n=1 Tax=Salinicola corii TaxID=2606937 RepID=A0A640WIJ3_9GAMM|nr:thermostable hemolysin [Salinicola corii]KAA0020434.1 hypothetical protein F0A16_01130 [Salinicola corii]
MSGLPASAANTIWRESRDNRERATLESFITDTYRQQHGASIAQFAPRLYGAMFRNLGRDADDVASHEGFSHALV